VPGSWDGFELTVRAILGQQVSVKGATTLAGRIARAFGETYDAGNGLTHLFPGAKVLASADFSNIGLTKSRIETIRALARAVVEGRLNLNGNVDAETLLKQICEVPGIGKWTAQYVAMRALGEPDAFPSSDLGLLRALGLNNPRALEQKAENWRPWRAYAAMYLWSVPERKTSIQTEQRNPGRNMRAQQAVATSATI
jgi:3-methyladenine DNA glycosylase/8-oxoguanine DNA glycosylase